MTWMRVVATIRKKMGWMCLRVSSMGPSRVVRMAS